MHTEPLLIVGSVQGVYGIRGWLKVFSYTQPRENILSYEHWWLKVDGKTKRVRLEEGRRQGRSVVVKLSGTADRDQAEKLIGADISISEHQLSDLEPDEYYWKQLLGLEVINDQSEHLGRVESMMKTGAHDVMVVQGERQRLIPFAQPEIVSSVDLQAGEIRVVWGSDYE